MTPERRRAVWAIYGMFISLLLWEELLTVESILMGSHVLGTVWCRRTDELVDGPNASHITPTALDRWEKRLNDLFEGRPFDMYDAALSDTVSKFPVDIQV